MIRKRIRQIHLYLGCLFAPLLLIFFTSGLLQVLQLHAPRKDGYMPHSFFRKLSDLHIVTHSTGPTLGLYEIFILLMGIGLVLSTILGIIMAFQTLRKPLLVISLLLLGLVFPLLLFSIG